MTDGQTKDYRPMWASLGLDLEKHDALLGVLGPLYAETFMSQTNRPEGMKYFDFVMSEVHGLRIEELVNARAEGRIVVGSFCVFVPEELILAVDGVSVGLCAGADFGLDAVEQKLPRTTCSLIKSFFGFALEKVCPYIEASDLVVGENTCDGKKKAYEIFDGMVDRLHVMDMPQQKSPEGRQLLTAEYRTFARKLEEISGRTITHESLSRAIETVNAKRAALHRLASLRNADPAPISGLDALLVNQVAFYDDPVRFTASVNALCDELETRIEAAQGVTDRSAPRVVLSGCPMAVPNWKVPAIIERAGGVIVGEESCIGERGARTLTERDAADVEGLVDAIVDRYFAIDCAVFTPNASRREHVQEIQQRANADGVVHYSLLFCTPYQMETPLVQDALQSNGVPTLRIDTDYGQEDVGQLRTRVEAFLEMLGTRASNRAAS